MDLTKEQEKEIAKYKFVLRFLWQQDPLFILNYRGDESITEKLLGLILDKEASIIKWLFVEKLIENYVDITKVCTLLHDLHRNINMVVWSFTDDDYMSISKSLIEVVTGKTQEGDTENEKNNQ